MTQAPPQIFDNDRRMALRRRAVALGVKDAFLLNHMADELRERLSLVSRRFEKALLMGPVALLAKQILPESDTAITANVFLNEEALPYPPHSFDLILSAGTLDSVNDLPGTLIQFRHILKPDGLFLGCLYGSGSLPALKSAMIVADGDRVGTHIHPQIDLRTMADLMSRAGFALPVADSDVVTLCYTDWRRLVADLRAAGAGHALCTRARYNRHLPAGLDSAWRHLADADGKVAERINILHLSGWAPSPHQPKPAKRGSGQVSLADFLG